MAITKEHITIGELRHRGIPIIPGNKFIPKSWFSKRALSLKEVRRRLSKIKGTLSQTISDIRDED